MELTILLSFATLLTLIGMGIVAIIGFIVGWIFSDFFIPPRNYWTKSGSAMMSAKFTIAATAAAVAVWGVAAIISAIFG